MSHKNDVLPIFIKFQKYVERYFNLKIKAVQSDWGGEYCSVNSFLQNCGIAHRVSCPHTHQQNGAVERKYRHIVETGLALLYHASVPFRFWDDAFQLRAISSIVFPLQFSIIYLHLKNFFTHPRIILS